MRLSLAANFDEALLPQLRPYPVTEIFGQLNRDPVGGGRARFMLAPVGRRRFASYVAAVHREDLQFNYLLNAACLGNREFDRGWQRDLRRLLDWLAELGVETVTVSLPFLLETVKRNYPQFRVKVGVFAKISTPQQAAHWERLGADCLTLESFSVNRVFARLRALRAAVACELQLLANSNCLQSCPFSPYHMVGLSHASRPGRGRFFVDYCLLRCSTLKLAEPANYVRSEWIRPEDLHLYEEIGYDSFKLVERGAPSEVLLTRVQAYAARRYDGNLLDLIQPFGYRTVESPGQPKRPRWWELREFLRPWRASPARLWKWRELAKLRGMNYPLQGAPVYLDNRALDGFLEPFLEQGCADRDCEHCGYCAEVAARAVRVDPEHRARCVALGEAILDDMTSGTMWGL